MDVKTDTRQAQIFFVDDKASIRKIVRLTLEEELSCHVTCFDNASDCLHALKDEQKDCNLLITDIKMPGMDGLTLLTQVRKVRPLFPILIVTGHGNVPMAVQAIRGGALDFIEKPLDEHVLLPAVERALQQNAGIEGLAGRPLTDSETKILQLISEGKSNKEMADLLSRSIRTVERHRYQLMHKLNVSTPAGLTKVALALGLTSPEIK
jgi:FixJ family two-component response regulator